MLKQVKRAKVVRGWNVKKMKSLDEEEMGKKLVKEIKKCKKEDKSSDVVKNKKCHSKNRQIRNRLLRRKQITKTIGNTNDAKEN